MNRLAWCWQLLLCAALCLLGGCAALQPLGPGASPAAVNGDAYIIVAVTDTPEPRPAAGAAPRAGYGATAGYAASGRALALAQNLAAEHGLDEVQAWTIAPLQWRCMLYKLPASRARASVLARLAADPRVQLAQPLNEFQTLGAAAAGPPAYNDPYFALQSGFASINGTPAQRLTRGEGVTVALIDTGLDQQHPELQGRVVGVRDFVGGAPAAPNAESHGTEVAGIIAAVANNGIGIVGVAPAVRLLSFRACWAPAGPAAAGGKGGPAARCNSFTLARALAAAIAAGADVINLSLGGPRDSLLEKLAGLAINRGAVVVGALPADGRREGFPSALPGVLTVAASEDGHAAAGLLLAPGRRILTLVPGGGYDFVSGSSMATAHVSGAVALMRSLDRQLDAAALARLLGGTGSIDLCQALNGLAAATQARCVVSP